MTFYTSQSDQEFAYISAVPRGVFNPASLTGTYQLLFTTFPSQDVKLMKVFNGSATNIDISYDGTNDHDIWPAGAYIIFDFQSNHAENPNSAGGVKYLQQGQLIYGKTSSVGAQLVVAGYR